MAKKPERTPIGSKILAAMEEAVAFANGEDTGGEFSVVEVPDEISVEALREALGMTREEFCSAYGFTYRAVENYETIPDRKGNQQVQYYLRAIKNDPIGVYNAIHGAQLAN